MYIYVHIYAHSIFHKHCSLIKVLLSVKAAVREMALFAIAGKVPIGCCLNIVGAIIDGISVAQENDELCGRIVRRAEVLKVILEQLQAQTIPGSSTIDAALHDLRINLEKCESYMESLDKRKLAQVQQYAQSQSCYRTLQELYDEVNASVGILNLALGACNIMAQLDQQRESKKAQQEAVNPQAGVYSYACKKDARTLPYAEATPNNDTNEFFLEIGWRHSQRRDRTKYEVEYDAPRSVFVGPEETGVKLGKPKVNPGKRYCIRIREITSSEPRKWSDTITVDMDYGPPNLRPEFRIHPNSISKAIIFITRPTPEQENGRPVTAAIVQIRSQTTTQEIDSQPALESFTIVQICSRPQIQTTTQEIDIQPGLEAITTEIPIKPDTTFFFQVRVKNAAGVSDLSSEVKLTPSDMIPGPPTSLTVAGRAEDKIKIAWKEPSINPTAVEKYQIEKRIRFKSWEPVGPPQSSDKLSAVVAGLETNKKYWFRVLAINDKGVKGASSEEIKSETKLGPKTRYLLTGLGSVGGVIGGILAAPITIPVAAVAAVSVALEEKDGAGVATGVIGVPLSPIIAPIATGYAAGEAVNEKLAPDDFSDDDD